MSFVQRTPAGGQSRATVPIVAGGVDWPAYWRSKTEARLAVRPPGGGAGGESTDTWASRADRFAQMTRELDVTADPIASALRGLVRPTDRVLDVGAGAGRYTFAVAPLVAHVTAVEPSAGMRSALERQMAAAGIANVAVVPSRWEDADVELHDLAFVSSVLYFVSEAVPFVEKLDRLSRRTCVIFHRVEERAAVLGPGWHELADGRPLEPSFLDLYNLLFAIGIRPHARILRERSAPSFQSFEEALAEARRVLGREQSDPQDEERIRRFLTSALIQDGSRLRFPAIQETGMIWWDKEL